MEEISYSKSNKNYEINTFTSTNSNTTKSELKIFNTNNIKNNKNSNNKIFNSVNYNFNLKKTNKLIFSILTFLFFLLLNTTSCIILLQENPLETELSENEILEKKC